MSANSMRKKDGQPRLIRRFLGTWLPALVAPVLLAVIVAYALHAALQNSAVAQSRLLVSQITEKFESSLSDVEAYAVSLSANAALRGYASQLSGGGGTDVLKTQGMISAIPVWNTGEGLIDGCYIYIPGSDMLVSDKAAYTRLDTTYGSIFRYGDMDYPSFRRDILESRAHLRLLPKAPCMMGGRQGERALMLESIVNYSTGKVAGQILLYLSDDAVAGIMADALSFGALHVSLVNGAGEVLAAVGRADFDQQAVLTGRQIKDNERFFLGGEELLSTVVPSQSRDITYRLIFSLSSVTKQVDQVKRLMVFYILLLLLVCAAAFAYSAFKFRQPYQRAFSRLLPAHEKNAPLAIGEMERMLDGLVSSRSDMEKKLAAQKAVLTSSLYYRLINGGFHSEKLLKPLIEQADCDLYAPHYFGVLIEVSRQENAKPLVLLTTALENLPERIAFSAVIDDGRVAALYKCDGDEKEASVAEFFRGVYESLLAHGGVEIQAYLGMRVDELADCPRSFSAARHLSDCAAQGESRYIVTYDRNTDTGAAYDYGQEDAYYLASHAAAGDEAACRERLDELEARNSGARLLGALETRLLFSRMTDTLNGAVKSARELDLKALERLNCLLKSISDAPFSGAFDALREGYALLCTHYTERKKSHNQALAEQIMDYLNKNFADENLCLTQVSLHFGLNERYLSAFFKEQTGDSFTNYVQQLRVDRAVELLRDQALSVGEVAAMVGYANPNTFRNAYKRRMGCTPSMNKKEKTPETKSTPPARQEEADK